MSSRVIRPGIQAGECDEGICALQGHTLKRINHCSAHHCTEAGDRTQVRNVFFAIGVCLDQFFYSLVDAGNDLIEAFSKGLEFGSESVHSLERHAKCLTQGAQLGTTLEQSVNFALLRCRRHPGVQIDMFFRDHSSDELCIPTRSVLPRIPTPFA